MKLKKRVEGGFLIFFIMTVYNKVLAVAENLATVLPLITVKLQTPLLLLTKHTLLTTSSNSIEESNKI